MLNRDFGNSTQIKLIWPKGAQKWGDERIKRVLDAQQCHYGFNNISMPV